MTQDSKTVRSTLAVSVVLAAALLPATGYPDTGRRSYKWVDDQGVTHYGDHVPDSANQELHVMNAQGIETARIEPPKTPEQLAAENQKKIDAEQQASRDKHLLSTYGSVTEIERLRDQRLALVSDQMQVTTQFLEILNARMKKLTATSMRFRPYSDDPKAPPMSDETAEDLVHTAKDIWTQQDNLREKQTEESNMRQQFDSDIARFKELKGSH